MKVQCKKGRKCRKSRVKNWQTPSECQNSRREKENHFVGLLPVSFLNQWLSAVWALKSTYEDPTSFHGKLLLSLRYTRGWFSRIVSSSKARLCSVCYSELSGRLIWMGIIHKGGGGLEGDPFESWDCKWWEQHKYATQNFFSDYSRIQCKTNERCPRSKMSRSPFFLILLSYPCRVMIRYLMRKRKGRNWEKTSRTWGKAALVLLGNFFGTLRRRPVPQSVSFLLNTWPGSPICHCRRAFKMPFALSLTIPGAFVGTLTLRATYADDLLDHVTRKCITKIYFVCPLALVFGVQRQPFTRYDETRAQAQSWRSMGDEICDKGDNTSVHWIRDKTRFPCSLQLHFWKGLSTRFERTLRLFFAPTPCRVPRCDWLWPQCFLPLRMGYLLDRVQSFCRGQNLVIQFRFWLESLFVGGCVTGRASLLARINQYTDNNWLWMHETHPDLNSIRVVLQSRCYNGLFLKNMTI